MKKAELLGMNEQELGRTKTVVATLRDRIASGKAILASELFPELRLDPPYTYCIGNMKPAILLPFYQTLIVDLRPLPSPEAFEARYGLNVKAFIKYYEQGRIVVRARDKLETFADLTYLDDLFGVVGCPPSSTRYKALYGDEHEELVSTAKQIVGKGRPKDTWWQREYLDWKKPPTFSEVISAKFALVGCYFGREIATKIVLDALDSNGDPGVAYKWLHVFSRARVYPYMNCLDGVNTLSLDDLQQANQLLMSSIPQPRPEYRREKKWYDSLRKKPKRQTVPYELGRAILANMSIDMPTDLDKALEVVPSDWMKVVNELDEALEKGSRSEIEPKSRNLVRLVEDVRKEAERMKARQTIYSHSISLIGVGILGPLAEYAPHEWKPIIQVAGGSAVVLKDLIARTVVKVVKPSHVAAWFDLTSKLDK